MAALPAEKLTSISRKAIELSLYGLIPVGWSKGQVVDILRHDWRCIRSVAVDIGHWVELARRRTGQQDGGQEFHHPCHLGHHETSEWEKLVVAAAGLRNVSN